jgi:hypothetical protein
VAQLVEQPRDGGDAAGRDVDAPERLQHADEVEQREVRVRAVADGGQDLPADLALVGQGLGLGGGVGPEVGREPGERPVLEEPLGARGVGEPEPHQVCGEARDPLDRHLVHPSPV